MLQTAKSVSDLDTKLVHTTLETSNSPQKSLQTASKSSSEGMTSINIVNTSATNIEEQKNDFNQESHEALQKSNTDTTVGLFPSETIKAKNDMNDKIASSMSNIDSAVDMNIRQSNLVTQSSIKRLPKDEDNFKVSIAMDNSLVHIQDDSSTQTSSSENTTEMAHEISSSRCQLQAVHSYRQLVGPVAHPVIFPNAHDVETASNIDPLTPIYSENNNSVIAAPSSEPIVPGPAISSSRIDKTKNNTYPRVSSSNIHNKSSTSFQKRHSTTNTNTSSTNRTSSDRRTFHSISTIKIPDNYQKTELAITSGSDHHHNHHPMSHLSLQNKAVDLEYPTRHRVSKTASFMNSSRKKSKMKADDLYNIPGQNISENHENYAVVYDLVTGIRFAVSRCSKTPGKITDAQFKTVTKLIFNREGNTQAPPTKYEFKFKDYAPDVFRDLRRLFNVNQADYLMSLNDEIGVRAVGSSGKSGSSFYYSNDRKFIIKTIHKSEHRHLRKILKDYYYYVLKNPNTLLCQFYGLHRLKMATKTGIVKVHVLVMNNLLPPTVNMSDCYDLKGSTYGRRTTEKKKAQGSCLKDLNFIESKAKIQLSVSKGKEIETQLTQDVSLLKRLNIMDYSLLLGLRYLNQVEEELMYEETKRLSAIVHQEVPGAHKNSIFDTDGGIRAVGPDGEELDIVYYVGIIDCLTNYSTLKKLETFFRSLRHRRDTISAVPPSEYGDRFLKFIFKNIETPGDAAPVKKKRLNKIRALRKLTGTHHTA